MKRNKKEKTLPPLDEAKIKEVAEKIKAKHESEQKKELLSETQVVSEKKGFGKRFKALWIKEDLDEKPAKEVEPKEEKPEDIPEFKEKHMSLKERIAREKEMAKREEERETQAPSETIQKKDKVEEEKAKKLAVEKTAAAEKKAKLFKKKDRKKLQRKSLQQYLDKAGLYVSAEKVKKKIFVGTIITFLVLTAIVFYQVVSWGFVDTPRFLFFMAALWTVVFGAGLLLVQAILYFFLDYRIYNRTREMEEVLPDFLQLASSNIAAGMPIDKALWYSIRPQFGVLAKEMEEVAKATMSGEDLEKGLKNFSEKYDSVLLKRSVSILTEGLHAGGEMAELLNKIALNIEEIKIMKKEMAANVMTYAIFITFAAVVVAPFLFALATELLSIIIKITGTLDLAGTQSLFSFAAADPAIEGNFKVFSVVMLIVTAGFSTSIVSIIRRGNVLEGIKSIPVYSAISVAIYFLSFAFLHSMFGGII